jgi:beta-galactosidase/beta-glucuronidase
VGITEGTPHAPMLTPWGERVTPETAWPEYPRPHRVRQDWLTLNGSWRYAITPLRAPMPQRWDGEILVPFAVESALSGVRRQVTPEDRLWYQREFEVPAAWRDMRVLLHFEAVDYEAAVWVNGGLVTTHRGGFDPFTADLSAYLQEGPNTLVVAVWDPSNRGEQPRGKQHLTPSGIWYTPVSGIWQTVWLEPVPSANHIDEVRIEPDPQAAAIDVAVLLARPTRSREVAVRLRVLAEGRQIAETIAPADRLVRLTLPEARLWSPRSPFLYELVAELVDVDDPLPEDDAPRSTPARAVPLRGQAEAERFAGASVRGEATDRVTACFGLRTIEVGPHPDSGAPVLLLNGQAEFHLATLDQGWWPDGLHTPPSDAALVHDLEYLKAAGFNAVRKHIKVEPARFYHHCDRLGILVWQDMPSAFAPAQYVAPNDEGEAVRKTAAIEQYELELRRMVSRLRSHPSIVVWVIHNEGWGQFDTVRLAAWVKLLDPTRVVDAASGWRDVEAGDLLDHHDYAEAPATLPMHPTRAVVLGEFGGIGWPLQGHLWDPAMRNWGYQTYFDESAVHEAYRRKLDPVIAMHRAGTLAAAVYTQTSDVEGEVNGLLTYDRRVAKLSREWLRGVHAPLTGSGTEG